MPNPSCSLRPPAFRAWPEAPHPPPPNSCSGSPRRGERHPRAGADEAPASATDGAPPLTPTGFRSVHAPEAAEHLEPVNGYAERLIRESG
jgi:hypothetical protein